MVGEMVQNSQSLYSFTFTVVIVIHEYIYSRSTTTVSLHSRNEYIYEYIYSHLRDVFIHIQRLISVHIHDPNIHSTRCNIHSTFSAHSLCASLGPSSRSFLNANGRRRKAQFSGRPKNPNTSVTLARSFFCSFRSLTIVRTGMEHCGSRSEREHPIRLEYLIVALQQVLPFVSINSAVLNEILGNIRLLHGRWIRQDSNFTNLAVFSLKSPEVFRSGSVGRPRYLISEEVLLHLRSSGFTLLVSRWILRRRIVEYGLEEMTGFSMISDAQLDNLVERFMSDHGTSVAYSLVSGHLRSIGCQSSTGSNQGEYCPC